MKHSILDLRLLAAVVAAGLLGTFALMAADPAPAAEAAGDRAARQGRGGMLDDQQRQVFREALQRDNAKLQSLDQKLQAAQETYDAGDINASQNNAEEALLRFRLALNKGREMNASGRGEAASAERQAAQDLKANVAVKSDFERAQAVYAEAEQAFKAEKYDDAADLFAQAESLFADVKNVAAEKRARALEAMQNAQQKISATEDAAKKADAVLEGGSR